MSPIITIRTTMCEANSLFNLASNNLIALSLQISRLTTDSERAAVLVQMHTTVSAMKDIDSAIQAAKKAQRTYESTGQKVYW